MANQFIPILEPFSSTLTFLGEEGTDSSTITEVWCLAFRFFLWERSLDIEAIVEAIVDGLLLKVKFKAYD